VAGIFAEMAPHYDQLRPLRTADQRRLEQLVGALALEPADLVIEVGCGTGRMTLPLAHLTPAQVMGVDSEPAMLEIARAKDPQGRVRWETGSAYRLPAPDGRAALVLMSMVVHLIKQPGRAFAEARRVLRPGGQVVIWTFTPEHIAGFFLNRYFPSIQRIDTERFPTPTRLERSLRGAGFSQVIIERERETGDVEVSDLVDRVRGRYISTLSLLPPLEFRLGLQQLEELRTLDRNQRIPYALEWAIIHGSR